MAFEYRGTQNLSFHRVAPFRGMRLTLLALGVCLLFSTGCQTACPSEPQKKPTAGLESQHLKIGQSVSLDVYARAYRNDTGLVVYLGEEYHFTVAAHQRWSDWIVRDKTADGYQSSFLQMPLECGRRLPRVDWFVLCGEVGDRKELFPIGERKFPRNHRFESQGTLFLFANDHPLFYWNNCGKMYVTIYREK